MRPLRSRLAFGLAFVGLLAALHCGGVGGDSEFTERADPCKTVFKDQCGLPCSNDVDCAAGLYCGADGKCTAECAPNEMCSGVTCSPHGRCGPDPGTNFGGDGGPGDGAATDATVDSICADVDVTLTKVLPRVLFLLDQSSSMLYFKFPNGSSNNCNPDCRWTVLKDVLIGPAAMPGGVIKQLQSEAELGVQMYSATDPVLGDGDDSFLPPPTDMVCPRFNGKKFNGTTFALNNYAAIDALLRPTTVDDDTPTGPAIRTVVGLADDGGVGDPKGFAATPGTAPKVIVLVTDGEPATCASQTPSDLGKAEVITAVQQTYNQKIRTFVIAIGDTTPAALAHFKGVANAGQGMDPVTGDAGAIQPSTPQQLVDALQQIVLDARTCTFRLNGMVQAGSEKMGTVMLNGKVVPLDDPPSKNEGWRLANSSTVELVGEACKTLKSTPNATLSARFPCGAIQLIPR